MSLVKLLGAVDGIISIKTHLKGAFDLSGILDLAFSFIEEIWHDVQKGYESILIYIHSQTSAVSPANNDLVDLWPNLWCNNSKAIFFLAGDFVFFDISLIFPRNTCFLCAICGKVTELFSFAPKYTVQKPLWISQVCPEFIDLMFENNLSHKSCTKSTLCNVAIKGSPWSLHIFICTYPFCFAVTWCTSATSMYLSVSYNEPVIKYETSGVMWHVA